MKETTVNCSALILGPLKVKLKVKIKVKIKLNINSIERKIILW